MSWVTAHCSKTTLVSSIQDHEAELMKISSDINYYEMQETNKLAEITRNYTDENELIEAEFEGKLEGLDPSSYDYMVVSQEKLRKKQENDNEYSMETQSVQRETDRIVNPLQTRQEFLQTILAEERAELETWDEATTHDIEEECSTLGDGN